MTDRLASVIDYLVYTHAIKSRAEFGKKIGKSSSQITDMIKGVKPITVKTIHAICQEFPSINEEWFTTGKGSMIGSFTIGDNNSGVIVNGDNENSPIDNRHYYSDSPDVLRAQIEVLDARIKEKDAQIKEKDAQIKEKDAQINKLLDILSQRH